MEPSEMAKKDTEAAFAGKKQNKAKMIVIRATPGEASVMKENAKKRGMSLSRFIRYRTIFDKN